MNPIVSAKTRIDFIDQLHQEFVAVKGYGASVYMSYQEILTLFNQFIKQPHCEQTFIKAYVSAYRYK